VKLAIVADVHGNLAALEAVVADLDALRPELVVHGGDLALNGPHPAEVVDRVRGLGWPGIVGNTDQALWDLPASAPRPFAAMVPATRALLGEERVAWLRGLPWEWRDQARIALVHAVPGDLWRSLQPDASDAELRAVYGPLGAALAVYCHIHKPYVRRLDGLVVANTGSVGLPFDGDPRASYLVVEDGVPAVRRVAYDIERHIFDVERSGYPTARWLAEQARTGAGRPVQLDAG
jgi:putative phosphoesterase